jgi:hypothetical protein
MPATQRTAIASAAMRAARDARLEDYAWLRDEMHLSVTQAAERVGVSEVTGWRYERLLKAGRRQAA